MLRSGFPAERAVRHQVDDRQLGLPARHVAPLRRLVTDLVHGDPEKRREHQIDDRPPARRGQPDRGSHEPGLRDRRVADALSPELLGEPGEQAERAADGDILTHDDDPLVRGHLLPQGRSERLAVAKRRHGLFRRRRRGASQAREDPTAARAALLSAQVWRCCSSSGAAASHGAEDDPGGSIRLP